VNANHYSKGEFMLLHNKNINIMQIADSGQCFRMNKINEAEDRITYALIAYGRYLELTQVSEDIVELSCDEEEYREVWKEYFDLSYDYGHIVQTLLEGEDQFLKQAAEYGKGIRILQQEPFEAAISFIISQNKNIPAIKNCIEGISKRYGEKRVSTNGVEYYTFPAPEALAMAEREELRTLKTGYRDEYIIKASQAIVQGAIDFNKLKQSSFETSVETLKTLHGVGDKVANCIALYGLHHIEGFPVDVWILRVLKEIYNNNFDKTKYMGYAGIVQQYMFYYMRHLKGIK
jgi:N-glycosylase/DNA lyase